MKMGKALFYSFFTHLVTYTHLPGLPYLDIQHPAPAICYSADIKKRVSIQILFPSLQLSASLRSRPSLCNNYSADHTMFSAPTYSPFYFTLVMNIIMHTHNIIISTITPF
ncbi:hypothetical protein ILYODFUR_035091 [Ilyodon furcidens]|uniref:Secreted protein n=1 Tax=Ilyodon furcidens TaxID=33524 RepID=A0ABV0UPP5_9TELE